METWPGALTGALRPIPASEPIRISDRFFFRSGHAHTLEYSLNGPYTPNAGMNPFASLAPL